MTRAARAGAGTLLLTLAIAACGDEPTAPGPECAGVTLVARAPAAAAAGELGAYTRRYTAEVAVRGGVAYTSTWGRRTSGGVASDGDAIIVWDVNGAAPVLIDSVVVGGAGVQDVGDVAVSPDGRYLVASTESPTVALVVYDLADPRKPRELSRFTPSCQGIGHGSHTAEIGVVGGRLFAFLAANARGAVPSRVVFVDLGDPARPKEVYSKRLPSGLLHDAFYRDGVLFLALWDDGLAIWDLGGLGRGGTPTRPVEVGRVQTRDGNVHNVWWLHDPVTQVRRWVLVGEEATTGTTTLRNARGDIHVVDIEDPANPREVAFYHPADHLAEPVGTHNFSVDEPRGILYAAMYNGGVHALDVRGDLGSCEAAQRDPSGRCDLGAMGRLVGQLLLDTGAPFAPYVWGVEYRADHVYASDMLNGLWKVPALVR